MRSDCNDFYSLWCITTDVFDLYSTNASYRYIFIFLYLAAVISAVSYFFIVMFSMIKDYKESSDK